MVVRSRDSQRWLEFDGQDRELSVLESLEGKDFLVQAVDWGLTTWAHEKMSWTVTKTAKAPSESRTGSEWDFLGPRHSEYVHNVVKPYFLQGLQPSAMRTCLTTASLLRQRAVTPRRVSGLLEQVRRSASA